MYYSLLLLPEKEEGGRRGSDLPSPSVILHLANYEWLEQWHQVRFRVQVVVVDDIHQEPVLLDVLNHLVGLAVRFVLVCPYIPQRKCFILPCNEASVINNSRLFYLTVNKHSPSQCIRSLGVCEHLVSLSINCVISQETIFLDLSNEGWKLICTDKKLNVGLLVDIAIRTSPSIDWIRRSHAVHSGLTVDSQKSIWIQLDQLLLDFLTFFGEGQVIPRKSVDFTLTIRDEILTTSSILSRLSPQKFFLFCWGAEATPRWKSVTSPKAGERESPQRPLGNSSQLSVRLM